MKLLIGLTAIALACTCFVVAFLVPRPAQAQEVPCETLSDTIAMIESHGGELVDLIDVRSDHLDQIVIVVMGGRLTVGGVKDGCMATPPIPMDSVEPVTPA